LSESDLLLPDPAALQLIDQLDKRGILQTIVSKNDKNAVMEQLHRLGIDHYFLYPAINWGQKSENLKIIAQKLDLNLNNIAVIDDALFEREEIQKALPQVRVYSETEIGQLLYSRVERVSVVMPSSIYLKNSIFSYIYGIAAAFKFYLIEVFSAGENFGHIKVLN